MKKLMGCGTVIGAIVGIFILLNQIAKATGSGGFLQFFIIVGIAFIIRVIWQYMKDN